MPTSKNFSASKNKDQSGIIHLWLILIIIGSILGAVILSSKFNPRIKFSPPAAQQSSIPTPTLSRTSSPKVNQTSPPAPKQVKKDDLSALEKYCKEEALKLPEAPFTYESKSGPAISGAMPWISQFIPEDKRATKHKSCTMSYHFNGKTAYGEMGTTYPGGISEFAKTVRLKLSGKVDSSWEKVFGKNISNDGFPMVLKRENPQMGTVDYLDAFEGAAILYIKFNTYYK